MEVSSSAPKFLRVGGSRRDDFDNKPSLIGKKTGKRCTLGQLFHRIKTEISGIADPSTK